MDKRPTRGRVLQCHSKGDRRFSPFFCTVAAFGVTDSIEDHYQKSKVFVLNGEELVRPADWRHAKSLKKRGLPMWQEFCLPNGRYAPGRFHVFGWYASLWLKYLDSHPALVAEASTYDEYEDIFKHSFPLCQADCIRLYCKQGRRALLAHCADFFAWLRTGEADVELVPASRP